MNHVTNDRGETVIAVGAPGSLARLLCERPELLRRLNALYSDSCDSYGRAVDRAIEMIREAGVSDYETTSKLLILSNYGLEKEGSVTSFVLKIS